MMRIGYLSSLVFALLTSASVLSTAAPTRNESVASPQQSGISSEVISAKVNLNSADAQMLQRELAGVGEAKALAIIAYRESNGPFSSVDELLEVKGIGKAILDKNRDKLEVN